ncbi:MAG: universal stress protein, partial [Dermatophilaceae bacterium]
IVNGDPLRVLSDASRGAEIVVLGSHGRGEMAGLLLGSVSQALVRHTSCPVMIVRPGTRSR